MLRNGRHKEVDDVLTLLEEREPRYARDLARKLDMARRWLDAANSRSAREEFWQWMDRQA